MAARVSPTPAEVDAWAAEFESRGPEYLLAWAWERFGDGWAIASSLQAESLVLADMARRLNPRGVRVFTLDTGRLPQETYDLIEVLRERWGLAVEMVLPDPADVSDMVEREGPNLFRRSVELRRLCCAVRKDRPLARKLSSLDAWATGLRRDQTSQRAGVPKVQLDLAHGGIVKLNPLADWSEADVAGYARSHDLPRHALYDQGYTSIGCACCTRPTRPGEDPRAGRWWWEADEPKECGIHLGPRR